MQSDLQWLPGSEVKAWAECMGQFRLLSAAMYTDVMFLQEQLREQLT